MPHFCISKNGSFWKWAPVHLCRPFLSGHVSFSFAHNLSESWKRGWLPSAAEGKGSGVHWFDPKPHPVPGGRTWRNPPPTYFIRSHAEGAGAERDSEKVFVGGRHCHLSLTTASSCGTITKCVRVLSFSWDAELAANCTELRDWEKPSYVTGRKASNLKDALTF